MRYVDLDNSVICEHYRSGLSCRQIGALLRVSRSTVANRLLALGEPVRDRHASSIGRTKYQVNDAAFDVVSEPSAYWAGFLMADGCIKKHGSQTPEIALGLQARDADHVKSFRDFVNGNGPITTVTRNRSNYYRFRSSRIAAALARFGVIPRKSLNAIAGDQVAMDRNFWRGVVDGDGWLLNRGRHARLGLCGGSKRLVEQFLEFCRSICSRIGCRVRSRLWVARDGRVSDVYYANLCAGVADVVTVLYGNCTVSLPRKMDVALQIMKQELAK